MIKKFFKKIKKNEKLEKIKFKYIIGDNDKTTNKTRAYVNDTFEFYSSKKIDGKVYLEQFILDSLETNKSLKSLFGESIILLETEKKYFYIYMSDISSYTIEYDKEFFSKQEMEVLLYELIDDSILHLIVISYLKEIFDVNVLYLVTSTNDNLVVENYQIPNNIVEPIIIHDKSLKLREGINQNKSIIFAIILTITTITLNNMYIVKKSNEYITKKLYKLKGEKNTIYKDIIINTNKINKNKEDLKINKIKEVNMDNIIDFKVNYKTEIKKLF